jgi:hypothetical protein
MAENSQGSILSRARLTVVMSEDRPSAPCNVHAETMSSSAILLAWERPLYNSDKVIAYSVHYMKAEGKSSGVFLTCLPLAIRSEPSYGAHKIFVKSHSSYLFNNIMDDPFFSEFSVVPYFVHVSVV